MPKELEERLKKQARNKGLSEERADAYVYGTLRKTGWKPKREHYVPGRSGGKSEYVPGGK